MEKCCENTEAEKQSSFWHIFYDSISQISERRVNRHSRDNTNANCRLKLHDEPKKSERFAGDQLSLNAQ